MRILRVRWEVVELGLLVFFRDFEPYVSLWRTASRWKKNKVEWRKGPFGEIDAR